MAMSIAGARRRAGVLLSAATLVSGGALAALPAPAEAVTPAHPVCDPSVTYKLVGYKGRTWYSFDSGTLVNKSKKATEHKQITHSTNESRTTTKSASIGLSIEAWVAKLNATYTYTVSKTVSYTTTTTFIVDVPPKSKVTYKDGIVIRKFKVKRTYLNDYCQTSVTYGYVYASDNLSIVKDA